MSTIDEKVPPPPVEANADVEKVAAAEKQVDSKIMKHSHDADEAMKAFQGTEGQVITIDEATNRRLLRIIDWHMMPLMCIVYGMNYLDSMIHLHGPSRRRVLIYTPCLAETTISYASVMGLQKDLHLVGDNYQWLGSMFYFGKSKRRCSKSSDLTI
jgi:ACS family allantoate permease-like MFS transporter